MKDIKQTSCWPQVATARATWENASPQTKAAAAKAYEAAVRVCIDERDGVQPTNSSRRVR